MLLKEDTAKKKLEYKPFLSIWITNEVFLAITLLGGILSHSSVCIFEISMQFVIFVPFMT